MWQIFKEIFYSGQFIPHGHCYLWQTQLVWLHILSDLLIAIAYFSIPAMLIYFIHKRQDIPFQGIFALFGAFIILCGTGHLLEIWTLWHPIYWLAGIEKAITALISCYTALSLVTLLPQFLALKTPEQLEAVNGELQSEIAYRVKAEAELLSSQHFIQQVVQASPNILYVYDLTLQRNIYANREIITILGYTPEEIKEMGSAVFPNLMHPDDFAKLAQYYKEIESGSDGDIFEIEYRTRHRNGEWHWLISRDTIFTRTAEGLPQQILGTANDITKHKMAESELQQQFLREQLVGAILDRIRCSLNLEEVLTTAVKEVRQFLSTDRTLIYRFNRDWSGVVVVESVGEDCTPILGIDIQDNCFVETYVPLYQQGRIRAIEDIHNSDLNKCHVNLLSQLEIKANLVVPILRGEKLWGLLIAHHCKGSRQWHSSEIESLRQLSVQLAIAIQQCTLFGQAKTEIIERKHVEAALRQSEARERERASQLETALHELKSAQVKLVQQEKMASLGQLVAGVAHEINNPVNFIYGNVSPAIEYASDLVNLISLYQCHYPQPSPAIQNQISSLDLDFLKKDFLKLLWSMRTGADRIKDIVLSLRNFSRLDEAQMKAADLHAGIDSTLMILQNRLKEQPRRRAIEVIKEFEDLPLVECYPGQLNQVFMNILSNAIDTLEEKMQEDSDFTPQIRIATEVRCREQTNLQSVAIRIADNGKGVSPQVQERLFDYFFTTKPVGKGTGLGLSISYQIIVEKHQGTLKCNSQLGKGTEFAIEINVKAKSYANPRFARTYIQT